MRVYYKQVQLNPTQETDYNDLANKPAINGVDLEGDLSTEQIKITWHGTQAEFDALPSVDPYTFYIIDDGIPVGMQESYLNLSDKPSINGQVLTGNKVSSDLNMYTSDEVDNIIASMRAIKVVTALPAAPAVNTMYYVGPDSEGVYQVYLFDSLLNRIDLGPSVQKLYTAGNAIGINETTSTISVKYDGTSIRTNTDNELYVPELMGSEGSGINPIYLANGDLKASTSTVGHSIKPVYLNNGTITEVTQVSSGAYNQGVPYIAGSVMSTGSTIQMHQPTDTANDWANIQLDSTAGSVNLWNNNYSGKQKGAIITTNGDTMRNQLFMSFPAGAADGGTNKMVANGAYQPKATKLVDIVNELRLSSGASGSCYIDTAFTASSGVLIPAAWYNYIYLPHGLGGSNGTTAFDNTRYGTLWLNTWGNNNYEFKVTIAGVDNTNGATANDIFVARMVDSTYVNRFAPFVLSSGHNDNAITARSVSDLVGRTYNIESYFQTGYKITGTSVNQAAKIRIAERIELESALSDSKLEVSQLSSGSCYFTYFGYCNGNTVQGNVTTAISSGKASLSIAGTSAPSGINLDFVWMPTGGNWWNGIGTIGWGGTFVTLFIGCNAASSQTLPCINLIGQGTSRYSEYSIEYSYSSF